MHQKSKEIAFWSRLVILKLSHSTPKANMSFFISYQIKSVTYINNFISKSMRSLHVQNMWLMMFFGLASSPWSNAQVAFTSSNLPIIVIETNGVEILDEPKITAHMGIIYHEDQQTNFITDPFTEYNGQIAIEIRGSSSQAYPKKSYGFETQDADGENNNVSLLGMPKENDWVLYAPYADKSLIRNVLAYELANDLGYYAPRTHWCELVLNGEYRGVYVLMEKIKRDKNRVDISKLDDDEVSGDELTGGYILKIDKTTGDDCPTWETSLGGIDLQYEYPDCDDIVAQQKMYIKTFLDQFETALLGFQIDSDLSSITSFIDINSFIDYFIVNELAKNVDGYFLSTFFYKDKESKGGKLTMGPVWDFNIAFGNAFYRNGYLTEGLQINWNPAPWWWYRLLRNQGFQQALIKRWTLHRETLLSNTVLLDKIEHYERLLSNAQVRNFQQWDILGKRISPNYYVGTTYQEETSFLKNWLLSRVNWLDTHLSEELHLYTEDQLADLVYPNPFTNGFTYHFYTKTLSTISLTLYDVTGKQKTLLIDQEIYPPGQHKQFWHMPTSTNETYILILKVNGNVISQKRLLQLR